MKPMHWPLPSPDGHLVATINLDAQGQLTYALALDQTPLMTESPLGLVLTGADLTRDLTFAAGPTRSRVDERYALPAGKLAEYHSAGWAYVLRFAQGTQAFELEFRLANNGFAWRYRVPGATGATAVVREATAFNFAAGLTDVWLQDIVASYEGPYNHGHWGQARQGQRYNLPALVHGAETPWLMVNEAGVLNLEQNYCISHVVGTAGAGLDLEFALEEKGRPVATTLPLETPWRYLLVAPTLDDVVRAHFNYDLNPASIIEDTSWIHPARTLWAWWSNDLGAQKFTEAKAYVDFAAANGFEAVLLDAGWDASWIQAFCAYAHAHHVQAWVWTAMQAIDTVESAEAHLPLWKRWGVDGVKIDFFENDSAHTAKQYKMMAEIAAREKLMVNFHGSTKPMGEGRTWPHFIAAEGIEGMEYYKWSSGPTAEHNCTVPFIRNAVGPMDYTPTGFINANRNTTMAHQAALAAVFESGCQDYAASIYNLLPWTGTRFLQRLAAKYDGMRLLAGEPGSHVAMLRWTKDAYVIGVIVNERRDLTLDLSFLPEGEFEVELYQDDRFGDQIHVTTQKVTRDSKLLLRLLEHGGAGLYIARHVTPYAVKPTGRFMAAGQVTYPASSMTPLLGSVRSAVSDEDGRAVLQLNHTATIACPENFAAGSHRLRLTYAALEPITLTLGDGHTRQTVTLPPASHGGTVFAVHDVSFPLVGGPFNLTLTRQAGPAPLLSAVQIGHAVEPAPLTLDVASAALSGHAHLTEATPAVLVGLDAKSSATFDPVFVADTGRYILAVNYYAAAGGTATVTVNGGQQVQAGLGGVGVWGATQVGELLTREVLVDLVAGANRIELTTAGQLPNLVNLTLQPA
ncbi:glycoside hydrolase family 97 catalytic domain-containing protein [Lacticaseibacillus parakribbianus]|uniref:glycoside hydrolase family 97 catalytic domain-containing protein n=1 Tax=Lacticaseibacillus parakribbianus TaxID=2970927 RepID=UPI0021CB8DB2|nr:glycoside hydrolase family 97 catalytic domain-containing protein [Lacticaseibacillus parakribbianus]